MKMRSLQGIFRLLAAALLPLAVACDPVDLTPIHPSFPGFENVEVEDHCIILRLDPAFSQLVPTKAGDTERGLDPLHENQVNTIDCFFFKTGQTDQPPIFRAIGRSVEEAQKDSTECFVKVYYNDDIAQLLFDSTTQGTCEAFVIANASINYASDCTLDQLRQSVLEYDFSQQEVQPYFTMCSRETAQVTLYTIPDPNDNSKTISTAAGRVPLYRCAAKIQLYLKLPNTLKDPVSGNTYEPCPSELGGIQVRLATGVKKTYANWDYRVTDQDYIHFSDRSVSLLANADLVDGKEDYNYGHVPFYSYPMSWTDLDKNAANYLFSIPWRKIIYEDDGKTINGYGEPELRYYKLSANVIGRKFEANGFYRTFVYVQSFGDASLDQAEEIDNCYYIISDWVHEGVAAAAGSESISGEFIRYKFLVVEPDEVTLNNEADYTFHFSSSADLQNSKVIIDKVSFNKYSTGVAVAKNITVNDSQSTVDQRTSGNANFIDKNEYSVTYNYRKGEIYFHHALDEVYEQRDIYLTVTNSDGMSQKVTIHQRPAIMLETHEAGDVFVNGYFGRVTNATYGGRSTTATATYYTRSGGFFSSWTSHTYTANLSPYYHCNTGLTTGVTNNSTQYAPTGTWYYGQNTQYTAGSFTWSITTDYGTVLATTNNMDTSISSNFFTTEINLSAFNSSNHTYSSNGNEVEYRIGDPRVKASADTDKGGYGSGWSLNGYLYWNGNHTTQAWTNPGDILICSMREKDRNLIAPRLLISSALNANTGLTWEQALKRGATYQETGYPAGRWRLPTEAEMAFIVARQVDKTIPTLYATNSQYWSGSGRLMSTNEDGNNTFTDPASEVTQSCRFVYDLWYWGDTPSSSNEYHPNGHNTDY